MELEVRVDTTALVQSAALSAATTLAALLAAAVVFVVQLHLRGPSLEASPQLQHRPLPLKRKVSRIITDGSMQRKASFSSESPRDVGSPRKPAAAQGKKPPPKHYVDLLDMSLKRITESIAETEYQVFSKDNGVELAWIPEKNSSLPDRFRAIAGIKAPAEFVFRCLHDLKLRAKWDKGMVGDQNRVVASYDQAYSITYVSTAGMMGVSGRDFLDLRRLMQFEGNKGFIIVAHSVEHPDQPHSKSSVRAFNYPNAQMIMRRADGSCEVTYFVQVDLKGWLSKSLIRAALGGSLARILMDLREFAEKNGRNAEDSADAGTAETAPLPSGTPLPSSL